MRVKVERTDSRKIQLGALVMSVHNFSEYVRERAAAFFFAPEVSGQALTFLLTFFVKQKSKENKNSTPCKLSLDIRLQTIQNTFIGQQ